MLSAHRKIERADKHFTEVKELWDSFTADLPKSRTTPLYDHPEGGERRFVIAGLGKRLKDDFSLAVADMVHNLRCALDHLAVGVVAKCGRHDPNDPLIRFPIHGSRKAFLDNIESNVPGISPKARSMFESLEPYKGGTGALLWLLAELDNADKHRLILFVDVSGSIDLDIGEHGIVDLGSVSHDDAYGISVTGDVAFGDNLQIHVQPAFDEPFVPPSHQPVLQTLHNLIYAVGLVVSTFDAAIWGETPTT